MCQSCPLGHGQEPTGTRTLQTAPGEAAPSTVPGLTFSPLAVRMLTALGTSSAVLVFLMAEMEATGMTACTGGDRLCHRVPGCLLCPCPCRRPTPTPAHLDVLEQEVGVEADVAGGHVEAAVVGHLSLPGAREAAQQLVLLDELPEGPAVAAVLLGQLQEVMRSGA